MSEYEFKYGSLNAKFEIVEIVVLECSDIGILGLELWCCSCID